MSTENQDITRAVREHYAGIASTVLAEQSASCCGPSASASCCGGDAQPIDALAQKMYTLDDLQGLPLKAALASLGCGNPTALAELHPGEVVLDLGSGGGIDVLLSARRVGPHGFAYGLDMTDEMLELARRNAAEAGAANVEFLKGDISSIPLPDGSVDVIISNCVINLAADKTPVLREAFRVLRPGGRFAVSDIVIQGSLPAGIDRAELRRDIASWAGCIAGALTGDEYRAGLSAAGFSEIDLEVTQRYTLDDLDGTDLSATVQRYGEPLVRAIAGLFTSTFVRARKPAGEVTVERAAAQDLPAVLALLEHADLPREGVAEHADGLLAARAGSVIVGSAALEFYGRDALLRSLAVSPSLRGAGIGTQLVQAALAFGRERGLARVYLLTETAADFFPRFGFERVTRADVPDAVKASLEFTTLCAESAVVMRASV